MTSVRLSLTELTGTGLDDFPGAATIATRVVEAINAKSSNRRRLTDEAATFSRDVIATVKTDGLEYRYSWRSSPNGGRLLRSVPRRPERKTTWSGAASNSQTRPRIG